MSEKYLYYNISFGCGAGLEHHTNNLRVLLSEAFLLGRIPIIPIFHLAAHHNHGIKVKNHLDRYYDLSNIKVDGNSVQVVLRDDIYIAETEEKTLTVGAEQKISTEQNQQFDFIIRNTYGSVRFELFQEMYQQEVFNITLPDAKKILKASKEVQKIFKNYNAIHIRRSDQLRYNSMLEFYTLPWMIKRKLAKIVPPQSVLYLLSDERKVGYFNTLKQHYQLKMWHDLPPIKTAVAEFPNDNYFLYKIEKTIWDNATIKINTFGRFNADFSLYPDSYILTIMSKYFYDFIKVPLYKYCIKYIRAAKNNLFETVSALINK